MTEKQKTPELKVIPAEELLDTAYAPSGILAETCVANVGNDDISNTGHGGENSYISYITVTDGMEGKAVKRMNDYSEVTVGGVVYRVSSVFADKGQMGDLLDLAAMEKISRIA